MFVNAGDNLVLVGEWADYTHYWMHEDNALLPLLGSLSG